MSDSKNAAPRPGIAKAHYGRSGPFGALLANAVRDPVAARALASAYALLDIEARHQIIDAVIKDATLEGISVSTVLVSLLSVEEDIDLARKISSFISEEGGNGLEQQSQPRALLAGDEEYGGVVIARPLYGMFVEILAFAWNLDEGMICTIFEPLIHDEMVSNHTTYLPNDQRFEEVPFPFAISIATKVLWNHHRLHGSLPTVVKHFADLFSIDATHE